MKITQFIPLVIVASMLACNNNSQKYRNLETTISDNTSLDYNFEDVLIPIDSVTRNSYPVYCGFTNSVSTYLAGANRQTNALDILDISNRRVFKHVNLKSEGPNAVEALDGFYIHNWDSIFVFTGFAVKLVDTSGVVKSNWGITDFGIIQSGKVGGVGTPVGFHLYYSKRRNSLFLYYTPNNVPIGSREFFQQPFIVEMNLSKNTMCLLPVTYSKFLIENPNVGYKYIPMVTFSNDVVYYGFEGESNIYAFDIESSQSKEYGARSRFTKNTVDILPPSADQVRKNIHWIENVGFFETIHDPFRNLFYRLHVGNQPYQVSSNEFNTFNDKDMYIMVFDKHMHLITELKLDPKTFYPEFWCVTKEGLLLNANHELNGNTNEKSSNFKLLVMRINS